ncbi:MAG: DUF927 domain-containing protein [Methylomicrobium sp.]|nr:DUF927 domain-containing protein [Methylomicrobium sp.]
MNEFIGGVEIIEPGVAKIKIKEKSNVVKMPAKAQKQKDSAPYGDGAYKNIDGAIHHVRKTKEGAVFWAKICNFTAYIESTRSIDDGLQRQTKYTISGVREDGAKLPKIEVIDTKFHAGTWVNENWGLSARIEPTASAARRVTDAIHVFSIENGNIPSKDSRSFLGWEFEKGMWRYLHNDGAITKDGLDESVNVELSGNMSRYRLPSPDMDRCKSSFRLVNDFLNISESNPKIGAALFAAVVRAPLYTAEAIDFCLFLQGTTGSKKSSTAAVALSFFGDFTFRTLTQNWHSSESDLEMTAFCGNCALTVFDDWKLGGGTASDAARMRSKLERFGQSTGNQAGRGRRNADLSARPTPYNRSMSVITAEELPSSSSLLARMLVLTINKNDVDLRKLTHLQGAAKDGHLAAIMSSYTQWLAPRMSKLCKTLPDHIVKRRTAAIAEGFASSHPRAPDIYGSLSAAIDIFFQFAVESKLIGLTDAEQQILEIERRLKAAFTEQAEHQQEADIVRRFMALLATALSSGQAHIADAASDHIPTRSPERFGWRRSNGFLKRDVMDRSTDPQEQQDVDGRFFEYEPRGPRIGWVKGNEIWLDADAAFAAAQAVASQQREPILTTKNAILQQMVEKKIIEQTSTRKTGSVISTVPRTINGSKRRVAVILEKSLYDEVNDEQN